MYNEIVRMDPYNLKFVPDHFKTEDMCNEAVHRDPYALRYVPDNLKTQGMCNEEVHKSRWYLKYVPDHLKTEEMYNKAVSTELYTLRHVPWSSQDRRCTTGYWKKFLTIWYAEIKNVLIKEDVKIWSKRGYD